MIYYCGDLNGAGLEGGARVKTSVNRHSRSEERPTGTFGHNPYQFPRGQRENKVEISTTLVALSLIGFWTSLPRRVLKTPVGVRDRSQVSTGNGENWLGSCNMRKPRQRGQGTMGEGTSGNLTQGVFRVVRFHHCGHGPGVVRNDDCAMAGAGRVSTDDLVPNPGSCAQRVAINPESLLVSQWRLRIKPKPGIAVIETSSGDICSSPGDRRRVVKLESPTSHKDPQGSGKNTAPLDSSISNPTNMPMAGASVPFKSVMPLKAAATLLLIENSHAMSFIWPDLRDHYLHTLVERLDNNGNEAHAITTFILETLPLEPHESNPNPRQYDSVYTGLHDVKFNCAPGNRLSAGHILNGIDFLASAVLQGQSVSRNLIIIAAAPPSEGTNNVVFAPFQGHTVWNQLAQKLSQTAVRCHLILGPNHDTAPLMTLFEETLRLQGHSEGSLPFSVDPTKLTVRISAKPSYSEGAHPALRSNVYGAKPARQPFFRDERVREKYRRQPAPIMLPLGSPVHVNPGGRAVSQSRAERIMRVGQSSPTDVHPRLHYGWPRKGSRLSSPEAENTAPPGPVANYHEASPITPYFASNLSSPVSPTPTEDTYLSKGSQSVTNLIPVDGHTSAEPSWINTQYMSAIPPPITQQPDMSMFNPHPSNMYLDNQAIAGQPEQILAAQSPPNSAYIPAPQMTGPPQDSIFHSIPPNMNSLATRPRRASRASIPQDEEPFTFNKEYVAATTALFNEEVLPAYPDFPSISPPAQNRPEPIPVMRTYYISGAQRSLPSSPSYQGGSSYFMEHVHHMPQHVEGTNPGFGVEQVGMSYSSPFSPNNSSSLTGWAG
ncbi:hypothetical protein BD779DRAFT_1473627 [Infundibulicybe gibba]|nr:hypothetical protein BD779DRAFT_1473627 [Infundibulicybe gibba]